MEVKEWTPTGLGLSIHEGFIKDNWEFFKEFFPKGVRPPRLFGKALMVNSYETPNGPEWFTELFENHAAKMFALVEGKVVAVRQFKQGYAAFNRKLGQPGALWELPGGSPNFKREEQEWVGLREFVEETGCRPRKVIPLGPLQFMSTRNSESNTLLLLGLDCVKAGEQRLDRYEGTLEVVFFEIQDWWKMCMEEIVDPYSIVATVRALNHLKMLQITMPKEG